MNELWQVALGAIVSLAVAWGIVVVSLLLRRPKSDVLGEILRLLPDTLRLLRRLATDPTVPRDARMRLWLLFAYLASPIDLIPDFIPVIGHVDDAIIVCLVLRSVVRRTGLEALRRNWPGTEQGLAALGRAAGLPSSAFRPS